MEGEDKKCVRDREKKATTDNQMDDIFILHLPH